MTDTVKYVEAIGRRKTARARVRITEAAKEHFEINNRSIAEYFPVREIGRTATDALRVANLEKKFSVSVRCEGGGVAAQAEALRHALARALLKYDPTLRAVLKKAGYLKRDPRMKERKKPGLKGARRGAQWSKR